jgi:hypothetical protein
MQAAAREKSDKAKRDLEAMTEKSQAVVRLNAQLMAQVRYVDLSVCLSIFLSVYPSVFLSVCLFVCLSLQIITYKSSEGCVHMFCLIQS